MIEKLVRGPINTSNRTSTQPIDRVIIDFEIILTTVYRKAEGQEKELNTCRLQQMRKLS